MLLLVIVVVVFVVFSVAVAVAVAVDTVVRSFVVIYLATMHLLVFIILYYNAHHVHYGCDPSLDHAHAAAAHAAAAAMMAGAGGGAVMHHMGGH